MRRSVQLLCLLWFLVSLASSASAQEGLPVTTHVVLPGDTWAALAARYRSAANELQAINRQFNRMRQPAIGSVIQVPSAQEPVAGRLERPVAGGLLAIGAASRTSPWQLAIRNGLHSPFRPLLHTPLLLPSGNELPRELPSGFNSLELSHLVAWPGVALGVRANIAPGLPTKIFLGEHVVASFSKGEHLVGLVGTGAFFGSGEPELTILSDAKPIWSQPWRFQDGSWTFEQITLTGEAANIDQASIAEERARLFQIWSIDSPEPLWNRPFTRPLAEFLSYSSDYGARRSYNGGPYRSYHEGVDFSAYGGTSVLASARGTVVLAEFLFVRGGAIILDHGLGVYTGYYHLSEVNVEVGQVVEPGQLVGAVGSTGLSTGNHLHWDLLVGGIWVDANSWMESGLACWILDGYGQPCSGS
jgi:murein DD-endopeptidase MepM/ murein hydrolase activator NlpD